MNPCAHTFQPQQSKHQKLPCFLPAAFVRASITVGRQPSNGSPFKLKVPLRFLPSLPSPFPPPPASAITNRFCTLIFLCPLLPLRPLNCLEVEARAQLCLHLLESESFS